jgi:hypothetical protein
MLAHRRSLATHSRTRRTKGYRGGNCGGARTVPRGDTYLRMLSIHGARAVLRFVNGKTDPAKSLANQNACIVWALFAHALDYRPGYVSTRAAVAA